MIFLKEFELKTKIFFGEEALSRLLESKNRKVMIIADPFAVKSGLINCVTEKLEQSGAKYEIFDKVMPDPPTEAITVGVKAALGMMPDCLMAVGGGSAMDFTKAVKKFAHDLDREFEPKFVAVPTTSGTGSEVTEVAVVTDSVKKVKYPLCSKELVPDEAILDAVLVKTVPQNITADTGMDILTHAIEAFVSTGQNDFTDALAERAVKLCSRYLLRSYSDSEDMEAKQKIHVASCMAGMAFTSAGLGLNHGMAHQLGAMFHIPHGRANAILLPHIISYNSNISDTTVPGDCYSSCERKYCEIASGIGIVNFDEVATVRSLMNYLKMLAKDMAMPSTVSEIGGIDREQYFSSIEAMTKAALEDTTTQTNPRVPKKEDIVLLYEKIWDNTAE